MVFYIRAPDRNLREKLKKCIWSRKLNNSFYDFWCFFFKPRTKQFFLWFLFFFLSQSQLRLFFNKWVNTFWKCTVVFLYNISVFQHVLGWLCVWGLGNEVILFECWRFLSSRHIWADLQSQPIATAWSHLGPVINVVWQDHISCVGLEYVKVWREEKNAKAFPT